MPSIRESLFLIALALFIVYSGYLISEVAEVGTVHGWITLNMPTLDLARGCL